MHQTDANGNLIASTCDFCSKVWDPSGEEIMIEGHKGSLLCFKCLSAAYASVVLHKTGDEFKGQMCVMCLEERAQPQWVAGRSALRLGQIQPDTCQLAETHHLLQHVRQLQRVVANQPHIVGIP